MKKNHQCPRCNKNIKNNKDNVYSCKECNLICCINKKGKIETVILKTTKYFIMWEPNNIVSTISPNKDDIDVSFVPDNISELQIPLPYDITEAKLPDTIQMLCLFK